MCVFVCLFVCVCVCLFVCVCVCALSVSFSVPSPPPPPLSRSVVFIINVLRARTYFKRFVFANCKYGEKKKKKKKKRDRKAITDQKNNNPYRIWKHNTSIERLID